MANFFTRLGKTLTDFGSDILYGVSKGLEGIVDLGIGLTGTVGGWFDDDFEKTMKDAVGVDFVGERMRMNKLRELAEKDSLLEGTAVGDFMDEVSVGVGNMLPSVAVSFIPGVGTGLALATLGVSAAGGATEEAVNDGAELDRALGYGIVRGGTEMVTEKVLGGATKYITGGGKLGKALGKAGSEVLEEGAEAGAKAGAKSLGKVAKTGIRRIGQEAIEEAGEEITSELLNPVSKTIYKGSEALSEYGEKDYWKGVGRAGLAGAATSVAYGGTVGKLTKTSGKYADVAGSVEQINEIEKNLAKIDAEGARTDKIDARADELIRGNLENISRALKASKPGQKKTLMKSLARAGLADNFNADGSIKDISVNNNYKKSSYSASMRGKEAVIASDLNTLTDNMVNEYAKKNNVSVEEARAKAGEIKVYEGELSSTGTENLTKMKKAVNALNERGGQRLSFVVVEPNNQFNGVIKGDVMYIGADALESGKYAGTLVHEYTHFEEGSKEYKKLIKYLAEDSSLFVKARDNVVGTDAGYGLDAEALASVQDKITKGEQLTADEALAYGTYQTEVAAHMSEAMLGSEAFIDKLVKNDGSLVEKLFERFKRLKESLSTLGDSNARAELARIRKAERLYLKAAKKAGNQELAKRLLGYIDEDKEANSQTSENLESEQAESTVQYSYKGEKAKNIDVRTLEEARRMLENGSSSEEVRIATGWFKGYDNKWRIEIDDSKMKVAFNGKYSRDEDVRRYAELVEKVYFTLTATDEETNELSLLDSKLGDKKIEPSKLGDMIEHPALFEAYPQLADIDIYFNETEKTASYHPGFKEISIPKKLKRDMKTFKSTLIHEIQHAIQDIEGFASGSNIEMFNNTKNKTAYEQYHDTAGEIEARDAAARVNLTEEERKNTRPDIDREDVIFAEAGHESYVIVELDNGMQYVQASESQIIKGTDTAKWARQVADYINTILRKNQDFVIKTTQGDYLTLTHDTAYKAGYRNQVRNPDGTYRQMTDAEYRVKLNAEVHINELAEVSKKPNKPSVADKKKHKFAKDGFTYRTAYFKDFDGTYYKLTISVGENGNVSTVYNVGQIKNDTLPSGKIKSTFKGSKANSVSNSIIPDSDQKSNTFFENSSKNSESEVKNDSGEQYSRKKSSDTITMSRGEAAKRNANYESDVIFDKKDIVDGLNSVDTFGKLPADIRNVYIEEVWRLFNTFIDGSRREMYIDMVSKRLYVDLVKNGDFATEENRSKIKALKKLIKKLKSKAEKKAESLERKTVKQKEKAADFSAIEEYFSFLKGESELADFADVKAKPIEVKHKRTLSAIEEGYNEALKAIEDGYIAEVTPLEEALKELERNSSAVNSLSAEELYNIESSFKEALGKIANEAAKPSLRSRMANEIRGEILSDFFGNITTIEALKKEKNRLDKEYQEYRIRVGATETLFDAVSKLENFKKGRFVNAVNLKNDTFKKSIEQLTKVRWRGHLVKSDIREKARVFKEWYDTLGKEFFSEPDSFAKDLYCEYILNYLDIICEGEGDLSNREIVMLAEVIEHFTHLEENYTKVYVGEQLVELKPLVEDFYKKAEENNSVPRGVGGKFMDFLYENPLGRVALNPQTIAEYYDGGLDGFNTYAFKQIQQAEINKKVRKIKLYEKLSEFGKNHKDYLKGRKKRSIDFLGTELKVDTASELYMALKDEDSALALVLNGFSYYNTKGKIVNREGIVPDLKEQMIASKTYTPENLKKEAIAIAKRTASEFKENFTDEDLEFIKIQEEIYNVEGRALKIEADKRRYGMSAIKEDGPYHHPLTRDGIAYNIGAYQIVDKGKGASSNKHRVEGAQQPLFILSDVKVLEKYVNEITNYYDISPVRDLYSRLLDYNRNEANPNRPDKLRGKLRNDFANANEVKKHGERKRTVMDDFYEDLFSEIEGGTKRRRSEIEEAIRGNVAKALLGANPKTILTQCTSLFASMSIINPKHFPKAFMHMSGDVDKYSKLAMLRYIEDGAFAAQANVEAKARISRGVETLSDFMLLGIGKTDRGIVRVLWGAAQVQVEAEQGLAFGTEENLKAAGELLDKVILETQQNALITTKSAAMRSDSTFLRTSTMFTSDVLANICKVWRHFSKGAQLVRLAKARERAGDNAGAEALRKRAAQEFKDFGKSVGALATTAALGALIAWLFRYLFHRDEEDSIEEKLQNLGIDFAGNMIGGIPIINDIYSFFATGYGVEDFSLNAFNEVLEGLKGIYNVAQAIGSDTLDERTAARTIRDAIYSSAHMVGIPVRNAYNVVYSVIGFNGTVKYKWDDFFYKQSYSADLAKAIEAEDEDMIATITGIMTGERVGSIKDKRSLEVMNKLAGAGKDVIPRGISDTMTVDGVEYSLTNTQKGEFKTIYGDANEALADLVKLPAFGKASEDVQAKAIKRVYDTYYQLAQVEVLGSAQTKATLFSKVIDVEELALIVAYANSIEADTDKSGKTISGSRRLKIERYVQSLGCTAAEKYMIMGYLGYKNKNGEERVKSLISRYRLPKAERDALLKYCGY